MASENNKPFDGLSDLLEAYEALALLTMNEDGPSSPSWVLLHHLNGQLRAFVDWADNQCLVS